MEGLLSITVFLLLISGTLATFAAWFKRCPSDKILVIYGKTTGGLSSRCIRLMIYGKTTGGLPSRCIHGGATFVWPMIETYQFLDLTPIPIDIKLEGISTMDGIQLDLSSTFTVGIATEKGVMENAAEHLLGLTLNDIQHIAEDIIRNHMPPAIAAMTFEELNAAKQTRDRNGPFHPFQEYGGKSRSLVIVRELRKVGIRLINANIEDVSVSPGQDPNVGKAVESPPPFPREAGLGSDEAAAPANEL